MAKRATRKTTRKSSRSSSRGRFAYKARSKEQVKKRADQKGGDFDSLLKRDIPNFTPKEGDYTLRILPPTWEDADHYGYDVYVNYGIGPDDQAYLSLSKMYHERDPIDEERRKAEASGNNEYSKELTPTKRVAIWVIDRDKEEEGPKLWTMPWTVDRDVTNLCIDKRSGEVLQIDHPEEGFDVEFTRTGTGLRTKYIGLQIARRPSPLSDDENQMEEWLNFVLDHPIPDCFEKYDYDHIAEVFHGSKAPSVDADEDDEDDEVETEVIDDDEEEEDEIDEEDEDEDEDEEGPPWDDDEEDEEEEEEEPEPAPKKRSVAKTKLRKLQSRRKPT